MAPSGCSLMTEEKPKWKEIKEVVASVSPLGLLFFCLGTLLIIMGIAGSIKLPGVENLAALENYRWASIGLGVGFVLLALLIERGRLLSKPLIEEIPPQEIQSAGKEFAKDCDGEMHWFNVPLGRCIPPLFDE
jgi:hypothetical protein